MKDATLYMTALVITAVGVVVLGMVAFVELLIAMPVPAWAYAGLSVIFLAGAGIVVWAKQRRWLGLFPLLGLLLAWVMYLVPWTSRKPFLRALDQVVVGMDETEVRAVMGDYLEGTGWPDLSNEPAEPVGGDGEPRTVSVETHGELEIDGSLVFRHSNDGRFNADWGIVEFDGGRVSGVRFSAD